uniref:Uncharacterized protein n=1 Tax=Catagonus wagneri TaxID=51154 RepID=A0A8C3VMH7_9CETA
TYAVWSPKQRCLRTFPECLEACGTEALAYSRCMQASTTPGSHLLKDLCVQEFEALWRCFVTMGKKTLTGGP